MSKLVEFVMDNPFLTLFGATCLIQISPIKVNPWTALMKWVKRSLTSDLMTKIGQIESSVSDLSDKLDEANNDISNERVQRIRWNILNFSNSCRRGFDHTREEWDHCIDELKWYEKYCQLKDIQNGVIEQSALWLRKQYHEHLDKNDFLKD